MPRPKRMPTPHIEFLLSTREQPEVLDAAPAQVADEDVITHWSHTDVWAQAAGRSSEYGVGEWAEIALEQHDWERRVVGLFASGASPQGPEAVALAEEQRQSIERWYFTCPPQLHREITDAVLDDPGFRSRYDGLAVGTAEFIRTAVQTNADAVAADG